MKRNLKLEGSELVCPHIYDKLGPTGAFTYIDERLIEVLRWMKEGWFKDYEIECNNYNQLEGVRGEESAEVTQHGLICNLCKRTLSHTFNLEVYTTDQVLGKAVILKFYNLSDQQVAKSGLIANEFQQFSTNSTSPDKKIPYPVTIKVLDEEHLFLSVRIRKDGGTIIK